MCNKLCSFLLSRVERHEIYFAAIESEVFEAIRDKVSADIDSVIFLDREDKIHFHSEAILLVFAELGGLWKITGVVRILPIRLRDYIYKWIAANRKKWFGEAQSCKLFAPEQRSRILS
jgi:predicted DCC family thiol-disulfide oxidoreductase YuxK